MRQTPNVAINVTVGAACFGMSDRCLVRYPASSQSEEAVSALGRLERDDNPIASSVTSKSDQLARRRLICHGVSARRSLATSTSACCVTASG